ncbi:MAG: phosphate ABC transporter permease subunit PstC [Armatimonadota bacterium]|nr:phosphate ABC transporter permease subunit PstC [bacterium]MCS7309938.1 phosphate ABC transporter permease subunit PstC [Armatimonadota bacterium]MDW8105303.1 phosphate ABC transporter permease subunit PstC [Armatimonadota bacterium]MDW8291216.1 phosphate ABC transporter permease subunit PstC [Armatimonadota bacterium]
MGVRQASASAGVRERRAGATFWSDRLFRVVVVACASMLGLLLLLFAYELWKSSLLSMRTFGWQFWVSRDWDPVRERFGALPFIWGTLLSSIAALLIAVPLSLGTAIFIAEVAPRWLRQPVSFVVELLAAIPSVVYGLWGMFVMVPWLRENVQKPLAERFGAIPLFEGPPVGVSMMAAILILSVMIIPYITAVSREVILAVPRSQREASYGLGATKWETIRYVVLRYARVGILGAIILGYGRAVGETMAVTMVIGNRPDLTLSLLQPGYTMASVIANEFTEATSPLYLSALTEIGLLLFVITLFINALARFLVWRVTRGEGRY